MLKLFIRLITLPSNIISIERPMISRSNFASLITIFAKVVVYTSSDTVILSTVVICCTTVATFSISLKDKLSISIVCTDIFSVSAAAWEEVPPSCPAKSAVSPESAAAEAAASGSCCAKLLRTILGTRDWRRVVLCVHCWRIYEFSPKFSFPAWLQPL
jgi:hypothetical protein